MSAKANYQSAADVFDGWRDNVLTGEPLRVYPVGTGELSRIEIGPGLVMLLGGAPAAGKSALSMQLVCDALRLTPTLKALVCNVEMPPGVLLDRQLARLSGVDLTTIRYRKLEAKHAERIDAAMHTLEPLTERLCFVGPPFDLSNVAASADDFRAGLLLLDYIQRIGAPGQHDTRRGSVDATMNYLRQFAAVGMAVIVVSAVGRSKDKYGRNTYGDGLNLASFRESSELEFGCDDAYILAPDAKRGDDIVVLRHLKSRYGEQRDIVLCFDGAHQRFEPVAGAGDTPEADRTGLKSRLSKRWDKTPAAADDDGGAE